MKTGMPTAGLGHGVPPMVAHTGTGGRHGGGHRGGGHGHGGRGGKRFPFYGPSVWYGGVCIVEEGDDIDKCDNVMNNVFAADNRNNYKSLNNNKTKNKMKKDRQNLDNMLDNSFGADGDKTPAAPAATPVPTGATITTEPSLLNKGKEQLKSTIKRFGCEDNSCYWGIAIGTLAGYFLGGENKLVWALAGAVGGGFAGKALSKSKAAPKTETAKK